MFTGIIEEIGVVEKIVKGKLMLLEVRANTVLPETKIGDSISVNGVCLTVTSLGKEQLSFDVMRESQEKANFSFLKMGESVNLERALRADSRLGGHMVSGHIDGVGIVKKKSKADETVIMQIDAPKNIIKYLVPKGSVTIDGVNLTVIDVNEDSFRVGLIPHTLKTTNLQFRESKAQVNLEVDMLSKYVFRFFETKNTSKSTITEQNLQNLGFVD